jgi:hypothetical protein
LTAHISKESDRKKSIVRHFALNGNPPIQGESKKTDTFDIQMNNKGVSFF